MKTKATTIIAIINLLIAFVGIVFFIPAYSGYERMLDIAILANDIKEIKNIAKILCGIQTVFSVGLLMCFILFMINSVFLLWREDSEKIKSLIKSNYLYIIYIFIIIVLAILISIGLGIIWTFFIGLVFLLLNKIIKKKSINDKKQKL
jgi:hypothetical protein